MIFSIFPRMYQNGDIWTEIDPWGVLKPFCTEIWYLIMFLKHFGKIEKNRFWKKKFSDHASTKLAENQFSGRISAKFYFEAKEHIYAPLRKKSLSLSRIFSNFSTKCMKTTHFAKKATFHKSVVFVAFVAFWGTTMLFFKKYEVRDFRKVYGLWGYLQPLKRYSRLKFHGWPFSYLWTIPSYIYTKW